VSIFCIFNAITSYCKQGARNSKKGLERLIHLKSIKYERQLILLVDEKSKNVNKNIENQS
jgi:hypothetical protein